jgi:hypothetical protein
MGGFYLKPMGGVEYQRDPEHSYCYEEDREELIEKLKLTKTTTCLLKKWIREIVFR